jgi:hypothetical protein
MRGQIPAAGHFWLQVCPLDNEASARPERDRLLLAGRALQPSIQTSIQTLAAFRSERRALSPAAAHLVLVR